MIRVCRIAIGVFLTSGTGYAMAQTDLSAFSLGIGGGINSFHNLSSEIIKEEDKVNLAGNIFINYRTNPWLSWQLSFDDMKYMDSHYADRMNIVGIGAQAILSEKIENTTLDVGVGAEYTMSMGQERKYDISPKFSLGLSLPVTKSVNVKLNYDFINNIAINDHAKTDAHRYTVNAVYNFGASAYTNNSEVSIRKSDLEMAYHQSSDKPEADGTKKAIADINTHQLYFKTAKSQLTTEHISNLDMIIGEIQQLEKEGKLNYITIVGSADFRGALSLNNRLANQRALNVYQYLIEGNDWLMPKIEWSYKATTDQNSGCTISDIECLNQERATIITVVSFN